MTRTVAITGATGFLGGNLVHRLAREDCRIRILARDEERARPYTDLVESIIYGDICEQEKLETLFAGVDTVFHLVSNFRVVKGSPESYHRTNHEGTVVALRAAEAAGVARFIHCSTIGVHGHVQVTPAAEDAPFNPGDLYQETKLLAEEACREAMERDNMEVVIVRPASQYGPGDMRMLKMFRMLAANRFVLVGPCRENFHAVYIDDLVDGFLQIMNTPGIGGEVFLLGGERYTSLEEYIATAARALGVKSPSIRLPYGPTYALAWLCELACRPLGIEPPLHRRRVRFFRNNRAFDISKAARVLGYAPAIGLDEGMRHTIDWYREQGLLPPGGATES